MTGTINRTDSGTAVISSQTLARGSSVSSTYAMGSKLRARFLVRVGRQGTTALTNGVDVIIRPSVNANAIAHPQGPVFTSQTAAAASTTCATSDSNAGQKTLNVASSTGFAAGDYLLIGGGTAREEWARVSKVASGVLTLDRNLTYTHTTAQADTVRNKADLWVYDYEGPGTVDVVVDYGDDSAGESVTVEVLVQSDDSINLAA